MSRERVTDVQPLQIGMSVDDLRQWASVHGVSRWLGLPARVLQGHLKGAWFWMYRNKSLTLEEILTLPTARGAHEASDTRMPRELQDAATQLLQDQAGLLAEGLADEAGHLAALIAPVDHRLRALWERLMALRGEVREHTPPRAYRQQGPVELSLVDDPPQLVYREQTQGWCGEDGYFPEVRVDLQADGSAVLRCRCRSGRADRCAIGLSAVDAALNVICDDQQPRLRERLAKLISEPSWSRALDALDRILQVTAPESAERPDEEALGWRLRVRPGKPLELEPVRCRPLKSGGGLRSWKIDLDALLRDPSLCSLPIDQEVLRQLYPAPEVSARTQPRALRQALVHRAVSQLVGHPRVLIERGNSPVAVASGRLSIDWQQDDPTSPITLQPTIDDQPISVSALLDLLHAQMAGGLLVQTDTEQGRVRVISIETGTVELLERLLSRGATFPAEAADALIQRRAAFERLLPVRLSAPLRGEAVEASQAPVLQLQAIDNEVIRLRVRVRPLEEGGTFAPGAGPAEVYGERDGERIYVHRDRSVEARRIRVALQSLPLPAPDDGQDFQWTIDDPHAALALLEAVEAISWESIWSGPPRRLSAPAGAGSLKVSVSTRKDWFGLSGSLDVGGVRVPLAELLQAVWEGRPFLVVDGAWLRLEEDFRERLSQAAAAIFMGRRGLEMSPLSAPALGALAALGAEVTAPKRWSELLDAVGRAAALTPEPPSELTVTLRDYQREGFVWMSRLAAWGAGAVLADDMGLGKTVQSLALLCHRAEDGPALVVAPTSVCFNWQRETAHIAPGLRAVRYQGADRAEQLAALGPRDVLIASYGLVTRDIEALSAIRFSTVIFDEAQAMKNPSARRTKAGRQLSAGFRLALSGTPIENHVGELWSIFSVVSPGLLGSRDRFRARFSGPIERGDDAARAGLGDLLRPFLLRRMKSQVAHELPERTDILASIQLSDAEMVLYDRVRLASLAALTDPERTGESEGRFQVLAAITRLRQIACHPKLYDADSEIPSSKMRRLRELVGSLREEGHRALIFSQFTAHLKLARETLTSDGVSYCYLDGSTPSARRQEEVERFQAGEGDVFFISLKAGGTGLNLTSADYVIHLDPWWNPAIEDQATDRAHRIGQKQPVTVYRLVSQGTIEESILELHREKRALVHDLLSGAGGAAALSPAALVSLIEESSRALALDPDEEEDPANDEEE
ncbi:MAG: superfamily II DNA or RNA helicase [Myxococcota bacterium]|jgi:superfamily II DNA or RNA helicase